jgi:rare lipoprotein A (peptidoglycan hydrolase)
MKKENLNALISVGLIAFLALCIFGIGYLAGHRRGCDVCSKAVAEIDRVLLDKKADEISDLNDRLTRTIDRLHLRIQAESWTALASWYGEESGTVTASGRVFDPNDLTAANWHLPFGSVLAVENISNPESPSYGRRVFVWVDDRGPAHWTKRTLDLSRGAAEKIGMIEDGVAVVRVWRIL